MASTDSSSLTIVDGSMDWSGGVDSSKVPSIQSTLNPNGLKRTQLAWLNNATVRGGGITQRFGWQPLAELLDSGRWQGGFIYEPDDGNPYLVCSISGVIYSVLLESPYTVTDLTGGDDMLRNPADAEMAWFCQGENYLVIQAGDYYTGGEVISGKTDTFGSHLPLFWNGTTLRRSIGITTPAAPAMAPNVNEIPAATCMDYYGGRIWYAQGRQYSAGDIVGGPSGNLANNYRDSILSVTENPLCYSGDGFTVPTNAGNIRAIKHSANINASLGEGQLYIGTRKAIYSLVVPTSRADWIAAGNAATGAATEMPLQTVVQLVNGFVGDRSVCPVNGDLYYQAFDPAVRSLIRAVQYFNQPGNTAISQNVQRALQFNDRSLMRFSSSIYFDTRMLNLVLPELATDGVNVIHRAILPMDFDVVTNFEERKPPVWEGAWDGLQFVQLFNADFGGLERAFAVVLSGTYGSFNLWELTSSNKMENGDNRVTWSPEYPSFSWAEAGYEYSLKQLCGGECWIDRVSGTVQMDIYYRTDAEPCWRKWFSTSFCATRWEDVGLPNAYPCEPLQEGYVFPVVFPEPPFACNAMGIRPTTIGYRFQVKLVIKGFCRICGLLLYAYPKMREQYKGVACSTAVRVGGMTTLPDPFTATTVPDSACVQTGTSTTPGGLTTQSQAIPPPDQPHPPFVPLTCTILTSSLAAGIVGTAYSQGISVQADTAVQAYTVTSGSLPAGLALDSVSGQISGTPTTAGSFTFTVTVTGALEMSCSKELTIVVTDNSQCFICSWAYLQPLLSQPAWTGQFDLPGASQWLSSDPTCAATLIYDGTNWNLAFSNGGVTWEGVGQSTDAANPQGIYERSGGTLTSPDYVVISRTSGSSSDCCVVPITICDWAAVKAALGSPDTHAFDGTFSSAGASSPGSYYLRYIYGFYPAFSVMAYWTGSAWNLAFQFPNFPTIRWQGQGGTNPYDPSGTYTRLAGDIATPATITLVPSWHTDLCP